MKKERVFDGHIDDVEIDGVTDSSGVPHFRKKDEFIRHLRLKREIFRKMSTEIDEDLAKEPTLEDSELKPIVRRLGIILDRLLSDDPIDAADEDVLTAEFDKTYAEYERIMGIHDGEGDEGPEPYVYQPPQLSRPESTVVVPDNWNVPDQLH